jgi:hypothetical protein
VRLRHPLCVLLSGEDHLNTAVANVWPPWR